MRRSLALVVIIIGAIQLATAARADAVTVRDLIELSRAGLSDQVLIALIDVDHSVFTLDTETLKQLKQAGVSDAVILAMIQTESVEPQDALPQAQPQPPVAVPVPVPVFVPVVRQKPEFVRTTVRTDDGGEVKVRLPLPTNCTKAEPVYWGFGGKLRPNSWAPPTTIVCR